MSTAPVVRVSVGQFDFMSSERETQVYVSIWEGLRTSYLLPAEQADRLKSMPWPQAVREAHDYWAARVFIDTSRAQKEALAEWLEDEENEAALYAAWRAEQIRRHPVAAELAAEVEKLRARVAELETSDRTAYRAEHHSIVLGLYTTREAAREHCAALVHREGLTGSYAWIPDDCQQDAPEELSVFNGPDDEVVTGYIVTPLTVLAAYDAEANE